MARETGERGKGAEGRGTRLKGKATHTTSKQQRRTMLPSHVGACIRGQGLCHPGTSGEAAPGLGENNDDNEHWAMVVSVSLAIRLANYARNNPRVNGVSASS